MFKNKTKLTIKPVTDIDTLVVVRLALDTTGDLFTTNTGIMIVVEKLKGNYEGLEYMKLAHKLRFPTMDECIFLVDHYWGNVESSVYLPTPKLYENQERINIINIVQLSKTKVILHA